ncbi:MAG TPA: hypothetical protein VFM35_07995 [Candidatus Binatia bacterium]|nr:hypothetical protein [Candidatus Binatia bacterium]
MLLFFLGLAAKWWTAPRVSERPFRNWKPEVAQAELWKEKGDLYRATTYYAYAAQLASSADDWEGLLAVACGLQKMGKVLEPGMNPHTVLISAMMAAYRKQSNEGLEAVATAFKETGEWFASLALSYIQESRSGGRQTARDLRSVTCRPAAVESEKSP